jgi:hypothetical protein
MRISDNRYHRDRLQIGLALRFLQHEARTQTIRTWTGLTDDRIRKLHRSYVASGELARPRHRGKSPQQVSYFTRSQRMQEETLALATALSLLGVLNDAGCGREQPGSPAALARGDLLCNAFEAYRLERPSALITFEHAVFLATTLGSGEQLRVGWCSACGSLLVSEPFTLRPQRCLHCAGSGDARC